MPIVTGDSKFAARLNLGIHFLSTGLRQVQSACSQHGSLAASWNRWFSPSWQRRATCFSTERGRVETPTPRHAQDTSAFATHNKGTTTECTDLQCMDDVTAARHPAASIPSRAVWRPKSHLLICFVPYIGLSTIGIGQWPMPPECFVGFPRRRTHSIREKTNPSPCPPRAYLSGTVTAGSRPMCHGEVD